MLAFQRHVLVYSICLQLSENISAEKVISKSRKLLSDTFSPPNQFDLRMLKTNSTPQKIPAWSGVLKTTSSHYCSVSFSFCGVKLRRVYNKYAKKTLGASQISIYYCKLTQYTRTQHLFFLVHLDRADSVGCQKCLSVE